MRLCRFHVLAARLLQIASVALVLLPKNPVLAQSVPPGAGRYGVSSTKKNLELKSRVTRRPQLLTAKAVVAAGPITSSALQVFNSGSVGQSASQNLTLTNSSTEDYSVNISSLDGSGLADFEVTPCDSATLSPNATCSLAIDFTPHAAGESNATLTLTATDSTTHEVQTITVPLTGTSSASCPAAPGGLVPLSRPSTTTGMINCFYNTSSNLAFATELKYLYNPGDTANTVAGNLTSLQFPGGFQLSVLGNVNAASGSGTSSTTTAGVRVPLNAAFRPYASSTNSSSTPSPQQAVQALTQGGNFALSGLWPVANFRGMHMQLLSVADPKLGFEVSGLSSLNTVTGASDVNENLSNETYFQIDALPSSLGGDSPGSIFFDYRGGLEHVDSAFVKNAGLKSGNSFGLQEFSAGLVVNGFLRVSGQRYFGPAQAFVNSAGKPVTANNFKNWQLVIQLVPSTGKAKKAAGINTN